jgi:hypothetical protein
MDPQRFSETCHPGKSIDLEYSVGLKMRHILQTNLHPLPKGSQSIHHNI